MPDILIRGLDEETLKRLKARAKRNGRSLQSEAKQALEHAAQDENLHAMFAQWREHFKDRNFAKSSVEMIREDRER
jgi:plasmid stability protein